MSRSGNTSDSRRYFDWLDYASMDILSAECLKKNDGTFLCAAFHCQQAIEKSLKAYYLFISGYAPDGHNVIYLCKRLTNQCPEFNQWIDECVDVNPYYISTRYPPDIPISLKPQRLDELIDAALRLNKFVNTRIKNELKKREQDK